MLAFRGLLFSAAAGTALLTNANADTPVSITYVPKSLAEASIAGGPWTLHQAAGRNPHDASGIAPPAGTKTPYNPPTTKFGTPYAGYCMRGPVQTAQGFNPMQPYYFPFARPVGWWIRAFSITGRAISRSRLSRRSRPIWGKAGFSKTRRWA